MVITRRDLDIINFLEEYRVASTSTIKTEFFPSLRACQIRLRKLYTDNKVKRARLTMNNDYMYYISKPKYPMCYLLNTEFYRYLKEKSIVHNYIIEKEVGNIRPDAIFAYEIKDKKYIAVLEVELSHKGFDYEKYETLYRNGVYKEIFKVMPIVYVIGKNIKIPKTTDITYVVIKPDLLNFKLIGE